MGRNILKNLLYFSIFSYLVARSYLFLDPDFGWRLTHGRMVLSLGPAFTDPFSYTMPSFPFVDHGYLVSAVIAFLFSFSGIFGLSLTFSIVLILTLFLSKKLLKGNVLKNFGVYKESLGVDLGAVGSVTLLLTFSILEAFFGIRAQVFSWIMFAVFFGFVFDDVRWQKYKKLTPFLFWFWANLHGSFALGIASFFLILVGRSIRLKKINPADWFLFFASCFATFINPYKEGVWKEVWSSVSDSSLRWSIAEWMPSVTMLNITLPVIIAVSVALIFKYRKRFLLEELIIFSVFLFQAVVSRRHLPLFALIAYPMTEKGISFFLAEISKIRMALARFLNFYKYFWAAVFVIVFLQTTLNFFSIIKMREEVFYPKKAVVFLKENLPQGEIFSEYGWGGYLIWKLPERRVFIDGRMPSWRWEVGGGRELDSAFDTSNAILEGKKDYKEVFEDFDIDTILWSKKERHALEIELPQSLNLFFEKVGWRRPDFDFLEELEKDGWEKIYEDGVSVIYQRQ